MDQDIERSLLQDTVKKFNEYVRFLVRNKRRHQADGFCEEKYARIATTGFLKKILAYFIEHDENDETEAGVDQVNLYEYVNGKLPGRVEKVKTSPNSELHEGDSLNEPIGINVEEGVTLKLEAEDLSTLSVTICVPPPQSWYIRPREQDKDALDNGPQMPEPDGKEENAPLKFPKSRLGAFCKAAEHIYKNAHRLIEWTKIRCWRLPEKYEYLDYPKKDVLDKVPEVWWEDWLKEASEEDKSDLDFVRRLISGRGECLKYAPEVLKKDRKTVLKAIKDFSYAISYASEELRNDKEFILEGIKKNSQLFEDISEKFRDDRDIAIAAMKKRSYNYKYVSERLKRDREIIEMVLADSVYQLRFAPTDVLEDKDLAMRIVSERGDMLQYLSESMRADKEIVMTAVSACGACAAEEYGLGGIALSYALGGLNHDREVVLAAVRFCGLALKCASPELKDDRELVSIAVQNYGRALSSASKRLQDDREIVCEAIKNDGYAYCFASERLRKDREIIMAAFRTAGIEILTSIPEDMLRDIDFKLFSLEAIAQCLPKFEDYGEFGDGTSEYYGIFEDYEETFRDIVEEIPIELLKENTELVDKICKLAVTVDRDYYDEGSNPYEDSHERLPGILKEYIEKNDIPYSSSLKTKE